MTEATLTSRTGRTSNQSKSVKELTHDSIVIDGGTQARAEINYSVVAEYKALYESGVKFPPLVVFSDGKTNWLAAGFHRHEASKDAGLLTVNCDVRKGGLRDAIRFAIADNQQHGLRRTYGDKRKAVEMALADPEWGQMSSSAVAEKIGVSHTFVDKVRDELATVAGSKAEKAEAKRLGRDGKRRRAPKRKSKQRVSESRTNIVADTGSVDVSPVPTFIAILADCKSRLVELRVQVDSTVDLNALTEIQREAAEWQNIAAEIRLRCEREIGKLLKSEGME